MPPRAQTRVLSDRGAPGALPPISAVYREPLPPTETDAPREMVLARPRVGVDYSGVVFTIIPGAIAMAVHTQLGPTAALGALIAASAASYAAWRRWRKSPDLTLRVEDRTLHLLHSPARAPIAVRLEDVLDVRIAVTTEATGTGAPIATIQPFAPSQGTAGPDARRARIALVRRHGPEVWLTDKELTYQDGIDGLGKTRSFLRKHGWLPLDEREEDPGAVRVDDDDDEDAEDDAPPSSAPVSKIRG
jgi:hypothetical protein